MEETRGETQRCGDTWSRPGRGTADIQLVQGRETRRLWLGPPWGAGREADSGACGLRAGVAPAQEGLTVKVNEDCVQHELAQPPGLTASWGLMWPQWRLQEASLR